MSEACDKCDKRFSKKSSLNNHYAVEHLKTKLYSCDQCEKPFTTNSNLKAHQNSVHEKLIKYECQTCAKQFTVKDRYENHLRTHTGERPFICEVCSNTFSDPSSLSNHRKLHLSDKHFFKCEECGKDFTKNSNLKVHMLGHINNTVRVWSNLRTFPNDVKLAAIQMAHKIGAAKVSVILKIPFSTVRRWMSLNKNGMNLNCDICGKVFQFNSALSRHVEHAHGSGEKKCQSRSHPNELKEEVAQFAIDNSNTEAAVKYEVAEPTVRRWVNLYRMAVKCSPCNKTFAYNGELVKHRRNKHDGQENISGEENTSDLSNKSFREILQLFENSYKEESGDKKNVIFEKDYEIKDGEAKESEVIEFEDNVLEETSRTYDEKSMKKQLAPKKDTEDIIEDKIYKERCEEPNVINNLESKHGDLEENFTFDNVGLEQLSENIVKEQDESNVKRNIDEFTDDDSSDEMEVIDGEIENVNPIKLEDKLLGQQMELSDEQMHVLNEKLDRGEFIDKIDTKYIDMKKELDRKDEDNEGEGEIESTKSVQTTVYNRKGLKIVLNSKTSNVKVEDDKMSVPLEEIKYEVKEEDEYINTKEDETNINTANKPKRSKLCSKEELTCQFCGKIFQLLYYLERHLVKHTRTKKHQCHVCSKQLAYKQDLPRHMKLHTGEKNFMCNLCGNTFAQKGVLKMHELTHQPTEVKKARHKAAKKDESFFCESCGKHFQSTLAMKRHVMETHEKSFANECSKCGKGFLAYRKKLYLKHIEKCVETLFR